MKKTFIIDKLNQLEVPLETLSLGEFDYIGEFTAKKSRSKDDTLFKTKGCFFRPNYERGILIYSLIKRFEIKSMLEIGLGRGYASFCAVKAMCDMGYENSSVVSVDPNVDEKHFQSLTQVFPREWFTKLNIFKGSSADAFKQLGDQKFDLIYIDGDHRADAVFQDWNNSKDRFNKFLLFDDYSYEGKKDIEVKTVVDSIELEKELIILDRRIFNDDRGYTDEQINYGQVLIKHPDFNQDQYLSDW